MDFPLFAAADPDTSRLAAESLVASGAHGEQCEAVLALVRKYPGSTAVELASVQGRLDRYQISRRLADLKNAGRVKTGPARVCTVAKSRQLTWETQP